MVKARKILIPFSLVYGGIARLRNKLYDKKILESHRFDLPVICVGNLSMGGTGKSPMIEYLISLLKDEKKVATLSRGYKRTSSGFLLLQGDEKAAETGDEPLQFKTKFPEVLVAVDEKRRHGIEQLLELEIKPDVILLDDAFQHRKVAAGLNILLTPYNSLYTQDDVLPAGNLREPVSGAERAQIVVVTKCPGNLEEKERERLKKTLKLKQGQELFFTTVAYSESIENTTTSVALESLKNKKFSLVTGIAKPQPLVDYLKRQGLNFKHLKYPDHHNFTSSELEKIKEQELVLTTEKDFMRLNGEISPEKLFFLPIKTEFLEGKSRFDDMIRKFVDLSK